MAARRDLIHGAFQPVGEFGRRRQSVDVVEDHEQGLAFLLEALHQLAECRDEVPHQTLQLSFSEAQFDG